MKRYQFWLLIWLPWLALLVTVLLRDGAPFPWVFAINTLILNLLAINIRRRQLGMNLVSTVKAVLPGIGYHEWRKLYFAKP